MNLKQKDIHLMYAISFLSLTVALKQIKQFFFPKKFKRICFKRYGFYILQCSHKLSDFNIHKISKYRCLSNNYLSNADQRVACF